MKMSPHRRAITLLGTTTVALAGVFLLPKIPQPQEYHNFADAREWIGIPYAANVLSNAGFIVVGTWGLQKILANDGVTFLEDRERWPYAVLFGGVALTCFGSGYYHLAPDDARLVWDRLPMTIGFMGLMSAMIAERIDVSIGLKLLPVLLAAGAGGVFYWKLVDDLRLYGFVQFFPALAIPLMMWLYPPRYSGAKYLGFAAMGYAAAKIFEAADKPIYRATGRTVSGHTLKHLAAAAGVWFVLRMLQVRKRTGTTDNTKRTEKAMAV
jgi:hypothetical protein